MFCRVRQQRHMAGALERNAQTPLMFRARACLPTWLDLSPIRNVATQARRILVINLSHPVNAKRADLSA
jgi:hypothetical protein